MPEEEVKQYECLCPCEHETGCIACENGNHDYHIVPPAGDAGPRQPHAIIIHKIPHCVCGHAHDAGNICSRCACRVAKLCNCALAAAPVSQEAAPRRIKRLDEYRTIRRKSEATAPDSAMRVAEIEHAFVTIGRNMEVPMDMRELATKMRDIAARERESEQQLVEMSIGFQRYIEHVKVREQELKTGLRLILESYREYRRSCDDDWDTETMAEASRLLGGESK